jgi:hypothetical protein
MTPIPPPTEAMRELSLGGSSRMPRETRSSTAARKITESTPGPSKENIITSERTGITYDISKLPISIRANVSHGFDYGNVGQLGVTKDHSDSGYYVFGMDLKEPSKEVRSGRTAQPDGVIRIYAKGEGDHRIFCQSSSCGGNPTVCKVCFRISQSQLELH